VENTAEGTAQAAENFLTPTVLPARTIQGAPPLHPIGGIPPSMLRNALGIAVPTGAFALSFGALAVASGLTTLQACALSMLMFTGGSQFALVSSVAAGGAAPTAAAVAVLLGGRNALYSLRISALLRGLQPLRRAVAAHLVIDESAAMAAAQERPDTARTAFWTTGLAIFILWNAGTLLGALAGSILPDPATLGLNAAAPAAFLALLAPRLTERDSRVAALTAALGVLALVRFTPVGVPVVPAALVAVAVSLRIRARPSSRTLEAGR
jgi:predicted branched-subunit amino acid permease